MCWPATVGPTVAEEDDPSATAAFWNRQSRGWAARYDDRSAGSHALRERRARALELLLAGGDGDAGVVLDVGCGPAVLAADLVARGWSYVGVDLAESMVGAAGSVDAPTSAGHLSVADARRLPFAGRSVDAVVCLGVIDGVPEPGLAIAEMARVLRPGGVVVVSFANRASPYARWSILVRQALAWLRSRRGGEGEDGRGARRRLHTPRTASALLADAGFSTTDVVHYYFNLFLPPLDQWLPHVARRLTVRLEVLRRGRLAWLGAGFLIVATRDR